MYVFNIKNYIMNILSPGTFVSVLGRQTLKTWIFDASAKIATIDVEYNIKSQTDQTDSK